MTYETYIVEWLEHTEDGYPEYKAWDFTDQDEALSFAWTKARAGFEVHFNGELCILERMEDNA